MFAWNMDMFSDDTFDWVSFPTIAATSISITTTITLDFSLSGLLFLSYGIPG